MICNKGVFETGKNNNNSKDKTLIYFLNDSVRSGLKASLIGVLTLFNL